MNKSNIPDILPDDEPTPAESAMAAEESGPASANRRPTEKTESAMAAWLWFVSRLAWAAKGQGKQAQWIRYRIIKAVADGKQKPQEIFAAIPAKSATVRYHLNEYTFEFRQKRVSAKSF